MTSYSTKYRREHPDVYARQQEAKNIKYQTDEEYRKKELERCKNKYNNNPEYKAKVRQQALARYYRIKEIKHGIVDE